MTKYLVGVGTWNTYHPIESLITTKGLIMTNISTEVAERIARLETKVDILVDTQRLLVDQMREALELQRAIRDLEAKDKEHMDAIKTPAH